MIKTITEEIREVCTLCGGREPEREACRQCHRTGLALVKLVKRTEEFSEDEIVAAVARVFRRGQDKAQSCAVEPPASATCLCGYDLTIFCPIHGMQTKRAEAKA